MNREKVTMILPLLIFGFAMCATIVIAADPAAPTALSVVTSETRDLGTLSSQTVGAQGGNVTEVTIDALTITTSWQGYYGQISGAITLGDASNNTFYNWSLATVSGNVYATRADTITWDNVDCATATNVSSEETYLGQSASDGDSVTNTYTLTTHPSWAVTDTQTVTANTCPSTYGYVNNNTQSADWVQVLLHDQVDNVVYSTFINDTTTGFDGSNYDFQLLVGENEKTGNIGATSYYFWVQLE